MSTATPPISATSPLLVAGNQALSGLSGPQAMPEVGENNPFTQVLRKFIQDTDGAVPTPENLSALQSGDVEQALPEQGSVLPLEGKLLPQDLLATAGLESQEAATEPASLITSDQDLLGLLVNDLTRAQSVDVINNPLTTGQLAETAASALLAASGAIRPVTEPALQTGQANQAGNTQLGQEAILAGLELDSGDAAMFSDAEPGSKGNFLQSLQEMRTASLPQAASDSSQQLLSANRETVASLMNAVPTSTAIISEAVRPATMPTLNLEGPINRPEWRDEMASRVSWLVRNDQSVAQLRINPAHLGLMEISIKVSQDQASVSFVSQNMQVREAVDQAIPRLREMLEQQGLNLTDVDISSGNSQAGQTGGDPGNEMDVSDSEQAQAGTESSNLGDDALHAQSGELELELGKGLLDEYV